MNRIEINPNDNITTITTDENEITIEELEYQKGILDEWGVDLSTAISLTEYTDHL